MENFYEMSFDFWLFMGFLSITLFFVFLSCFGLTVPVLIDILIKVIKNAPRDLKALVKFIRASLSVAKCKYFDQSVDQLFLKTVEKNGDKIAIYYQDEKWTFKKLHQYSNQVANCLTESGFTEGDKVCFMMSNRPEYIALWLGMVKIGVIPAMLNVNVKQDFLLHAINIINCKAIIFENKYHEAMAEIVPQLSQNRPDMQFFCFGDLDDDNNNPKDEFHCQPFHQMIAFYEKSKDFLHNHSIKLHFNSVLCYLYTSGTTGYSKAAIFKHYRYIFLSINTKIMMGLNDNDIVYISLPLYHANSMLSCSMALNHGISIVIKGKFSASQFWTDCARYKCTAANYIGEICRYLLAQPVRESDRAHNLKVMYGNGLRAKIWRDFQHRFNIPLIVEFYGSTEGNASLINITGHEGACGFYPYYLGIISRALYPLMILKVDEMTGELVRDKNGLCVSVGPGEVGQIANRIKASNVLTSFDGYTNESETSKKIITDVFSVGDRAFITGDLVRIDQDGYLYFVDRTGDTFRWKGENVSTAEVEAIVQKVTQLSDCIVFGVEVPGCEGKAGMVVIADKERNIDPRQLAQDLAKQLPTFALPVFLRLTDQIEMTGSYKFVKNNYVKTGYCPELTTDPIYVLDSNETKAYYTDIRLTPELYEEIISARIRL